MTDEDAREALLRLASFEHAADVIGAASEDVRNVVEHAIEVRDLIRSMPKDKLASIRERLASAVDSRVEHVAHIRGIKTHTPIRPLSADANVEREVFASALEVEAARREAEALLYRWTALTARILNDVDARLEERRM